MKIKVFLMIILSFMLTGFGCEWGSEYNSMTELDYDYTWGDYDSIPEAIIQVPEVVSSGEKFEIVVSVTHNSNEVQLLHSIDIGETYLEGIAVTSSIPDFIESYAIEDGTYSHTLLVDIPIDGSVIIFNAVAVESGNWSGVFDVCFDDGANCSFYKISTRVE